MLNTMSTTIFCDRKLFDISAQEFLGPITIILSYSLLTPNSAPKNKNNFDQVFHPNLQTKISCVNLIAERKLRYRIFRHLFLEWDKPKDFFEVRICKFIKLSESSKLSRWQFFRVDQFIFYFFNRLFE